MDRLIDATGRPALGLFTEPVLDVNFPDFRYANPFGRPYGSLKKRFAFKQFQFLGAVSPGLVFGCAIVDVKFMSSAFVYFFDPRTGRRVGSSFQRPLWGAKFDRTPETGSASFTSGANSFLMEAAAGVRRLNVRLKNGTRVEAEFSEADQEPLRICTKAGYTGWVFVRKTAAMRTTGRVECALGTFDLGAIDALGHNDWSAGFMRRETFWNWASIGGRLADGRTLGLNVSCGVNETSYTENCFWLNGRLIKTDLASFHFDPSDVHKPWHVRSNDGRVDLEFKPVGEHREKINAGILASNFVQLIGRFYGTLRADNETIRVDGLYGYAEDHFARW